ncbi:MAG: glycoside hydrolase family 3 C-terminal domain-containing protein [Treponemataceae bacterium]|nr:glycoside hydrolase family 3 C-terminal domain-containing protein [Treponemataceae bacterium]
MKWLRHKYQPVKPLGPDGRRASGSAEHICLSRTAAGEGIVLLKNEGAVLPLKTGRKIVLLGKASEEYIKGGGGSGDVSTAYVRTLYEAFAEKAAEGKVSLYDGLHQFYADNIAGQYARGQEPGMTREPALSADQIAAAAAYTDTAVVCICRFSGEGWDRFCLDSANVTQTADEIAQSEIWDGEKKEKEEGKDLFERGDFYLSNAEEALVAAAKAHFKNIIVLLNVGGMVDSKWFAGDAAIAGVLYIGQGGMEGASAAADIVCGDVNPSGHLTDTFAVDLASYPSTPGFHDSSEYVEYTEDIFVGYRYFETVPGKAAEVVYPFGYGLSYTTFSVVQTGQTADGDTLSFDFTVTNTGSAAGKEVVQLYYGAPEGKLTRPARELGAFAKTKLLAPGESQKLTLTLKTGRMAAYDDEGAVCRSAWVLEAGDYHFFYGENVRDAVETSGVYTVPEVRVVEQLSAKLTPKKLTKRMLSDGSFRPVATGEYDVIQRPAYMDNPDNIEAIIPEVRFEHRSSFKELFNPQGPRFEKVADGRQTLDEFMAELSTEELVWLLGGQPNTTVANTFGMGNIRSKGIPNIMTADGPAGLRISRELETFTTAWPCATMLASTWNTEVVEAVGKAAAIEVKENNIGIWLAPGMNIHRSPLCGRNFEYYSEDPLIAGSMGAAMVKGVQSQHIAATPKHFAFNNKETNRKFSDSRVSERAGREIYLRAFEQVVREADPWLIMSSYNIINGKYASENRELLTDILRGEWGFNGLVTTDWWTRAEHWREIAAGNDVKMANGYPELVLEALEDGRLSLDDVKTSARRVLEMILKQD